MGQLSDMTITTSVVKTPNGDFSVRGISFSDITLLVSSHGAEITLLFTKFTNGEALNERDVKTVLFSLMPQMPDLVAEAIALAADDYTPEAIANVRKIPFQYQFEALEKIYQNTFTTDAELEKFMESIIRMLAKATGLVQQMKLPISDLGFGASDDK
jgi:hypothetical protein